MSELNFGMIQKKSVKMSFDIVDIVLNNLLDRRGIKNGFENIDPDIFVEMKWEIAKEINVYLEEQANG